MHKNPSATLVKTRQRNIPKRKKENPSYDLAEQNRHSSLHLPQQVRFFLSFFLFFFFPPIVPFNVSRSRGFHLSSSWFPASIHLAKQEERRWKKKLSRIERDAMQSVFPRCLSNCHVAKIKMRADNTQQIWRNYARRMIYQALKSPGTQARSRSFWKNIPAKITPLGLSKSLEQD